MKAVDSFVEKVRNDINVIAVVVCGSLSYDVVWDKSDIDITVIIRDQKIDNYAYCIIEDGITLSVELAPRSKFKRYLESSGSLGGSFTQAYFSNAQLVYTTDDSLYECFEEIKSIGIGDIPLTALRIAADLLHFRAKSLKWVKARKDPLYAQYFLLMAAESVANTELCLQGIPFSRNGIQKALTQNPELMRPFYLDPMSRRLSEEEILATIHKIDDYLTRNIDVLKQPVVEYLSDRDLKTMTMINKHSHSAGDALSYVFDFLAEKGIIEKVSKTIRLTPKSKATVEEIGYLYVG